MPSVGTILLGMLMVPTIGPLLLVGVCTPAFYFDLRIATWSRCDRLGAERAMATRIVSASQP
jgi:hypothetical protein